MSFTVAAFYHFTRIKDPQSRKAPLLHLCRSEEIRGTLILAHEGINGTIAGSAEGIDGVLMHLRRWPEVGEIEVKYSYAANQVFNRMKIKVKHEIVTMGKSDIDPLKGVGTYVNPKDWNSLISRNDVLIVDTRNMFEYAVGRFRNAVDPGTMTFDKFPEWADQLASGPEKPKSVAMYCTGGIRCEKATAYMRQIGFDEVFHLKGGILKYLEEVPEEESLWEGECFVFDQRVALKHGLVEGEYTLCYGCQNPISPDDRKSPLFEEGVSCARCHDSLSHYDRERYRERQKQITLSLKRGELHMRDGATTEARSS
jgi:UPF0176 protein